MEGEEEGGIRLSKRFSDNGGEVDYKTKAGTAWSHSYLNQKPWHPLSYPNQRRKWIAEQTYAQRQRRSEEVAREYAQEQEFFRQTALISKKDREKVETMKAVSFMYVRPPGYNAESAKAAEIADERKRQEENNSLQNAPTDSTSSAMPPECVLGNDDTGHEKKKPRPKDVFGRPLPTEEEFEILKNAPRLDTGVPARAKPFGVEVRNVKCVRCGNYGHQSGDRECPLKDAIMPNEESRLKRDDPLTAIMAHVDPSEPLKWELKQKPGLSPPRGGFKPDDPNQQIVAEDIFDEYGGFLSGGNIPELLTNFTSTKPCKKSRRRSKHKRSSQSDKHGLSSPSEDREKRSKRKEKQSKHKGKRKHSKWSSSDDTEFGRHCRNSRHKSFHYEDLDSDRNQKSRSSREKHYYSSEDDFERHQRSGKNVHEHSYSSEDSDSSQHDRSKKRREKHCYSSEDDAYWHHRNEKSRHKRCTSSEDSDFDGHHKSKKSRRKFSDSCKLNFDRHHRRKRSRVKVSHTHSIEDSESDRYRKTKHQ